MTTKLSFRAWLVAGCCCLSGPVAAQLSVPVGGAVPGGPAPAPVTAPYAAAGRPTGPEMLGGPPQPASMLPAVAPDPDLARLLQLPRADEPGGGQQLAAALKRAFPAAGLPGGFRSDVAARATPRPVAGSPGLLLLALPATGPGAPAGGAVPGQRLRLLGPAGEVVVVVARPAAAGSQALVVRAAPGLAGQRVVVCGLEYPAAASVDYEALALLSLRATQQLAAQLTEVQQQLASLQDQLGAARRLNAGLLLDHALLQDLQQQLNLLQSQQAAAMSAARPRRGQSWLTD